MAGTQLDCTGIVSGNTIGSITVVDGTDTGNSVNDVVEMIPTAAWGQDLADALTNQHSRTGTHTIITATSLTTTGNASIGGNETVAGNLAVTGTTTLTGATTITALSNPYKFGVYRNAAWTVGNGAYALVTFDTAIFDTSSNYSTSTGKFTAPIAGFYQFNWVTTFAINASSIAQSALYINGVAAPLGSGNQVGTGGFSANSAGSTLEKLAAGDYVQIYAYGSGASGTTGRSTSFSGFLMSAT